MTTKGQKYGPREKLDEREIVFLANYYASDSKTRGKGMDSALAAGYSDSTAFQKSGRILKKFGDCSFAVSAKAFGITKPYLAFRLKQILEMPIEKNVKEVIAAMRLSLANFGEATDQSGSSVTVNSTGPTMVIVGASPERMRALREATVQPTEEQLELARQARVKKRLEMMDRGELPKIERLADGRNRKRQKVIDVEIDLPDAQGKDNRSDAG